MKIGILTFHWATNYGAVLQAYALQTFLKKMGHDVNVINYAPYTAKKNLLKCFIGRNPIKIPSKLIDFLKERRIEKFRNRYLQRTQKYSSFEELVKSPPKMDLYICGSDQVWNPYFAEKGEGKRTLSYFLDFGPKATGRIAYAVSFGCLGYPEELSLIVQPLVKRFNRLSVREYSGIQILNNLGCENISLMPDPTLLLTIQDYKKLFLDCNKTSSGHIFIYSLHFDQLMMRKITRHIKNYFNTELFETSRLKNCSIGISDWLSKIKNSKAVVTNSFHGVVFSIIFRKPFIAVPVEGKNTAMNDRLVTLLGRLNLNEHLLEDQSDIKEKIQFLMTKNIDWHAIEKTIEEMQNDAKEFLKESISAISQPANAKEV